MKFVQPIGNRLQSNNKIRSRFCAKYIAMTTSPVPQFRYQFNQCCMKQKLVILFIPFHPIPKEDFLDYKELFLPHRSPIRCNFR